MESTIWGERAGIRPLRPWDAVWIRRFALDAELTDLLYEEAVGPLPPALAIAFDIFMQRLTMRPSWAIVDREGRFAGEVRLWRISERNRSAMLTIYVGRRDLWGQGVGTEALRLALWQAFGPMGLQRVELHVFDFNERAIRSYEKVGFVREGARRKALLRAGRSHDILVMGILKQEFLSREAERSRIS